MYLSILFLSCILVRMTISYSSSWFGISNTTESAELQCSSRDPEEVIYYGETMQAKLQHRDRNRSKTRHEEDPLKEFQEIVHRFIYGPKVETDLKFEYDSKNKAAKLSNRVTTKEPPDKLVHYPNGNAMRADLFQNKSRVHMIPPEYLHRGHCRLNVTSDLMQTAVNAFAILLSGNVEDILQLPADYVLNSARSIAMMKLANEKFSATWKVVKGDHKPREVPYSTLEKFRPLFKYLNGNEMAKLNLTDNRILTFIGTHAELNRHQMGVVASKYMKLNPQWSEPKYLNLMNNLLCGVPMSFMRRIGSNIYLQLTHQAFYHIRACDPLQRRFYLAMMTRTEALGKSYSWSARDVSRMGLLLAELEGPELAAINPEAMSGITAQVMLEMPAQNLQYITEVQLRYLGLKPLNILARKIKAYQDQLKVLNVGSKTTSTLTESTLSCITYFVSIILGYKLGYS